MKVIIKNIARVFDSFFKIDRAVLQYERFDGMMTDDVVRLNFNRGNSVAVLLVNLQKQKVILIRQFRFPAYVSDLQNGWVLEIVAGMLNPGDDPQTIAKKETLEEVGFIVENLKLIYTILPSPGGSSEKVFIYYAEVTEAQRSTGGGGLKEEAEDVQVVEMSITEAFQLLKSGRIQDAKTIIALQWLMARMD